MDNKRVIGATCATVFVADVVDLIPRVNRREQI